MITTKHQLTENELAHKRRMIRRQIRVAGHDSPIKQNISLQELRELARDLGLTPFNACIKRSTTDFTYCRLEKGHSENCSFPEKTTPANFRLIHISTHSEWMVQPFDTWDEAVEGLQKYSQGGRKACVIEDKDGNRWTVEEAINRKKGSAYALKCSNKQGTPGDHDAEGWLLSPEGKKITHQCERCAEEIIKEYKDKMNWEWSFKPYDFRVISTKKVADRSGMDLASRLQARLNG